MYDIKPLEEEWSRYRRKKMRPWYMLLIVFLILSLLTFVFFNNKDLILTKFGYTEQNLTQKSKKSLEVRKILLDNAFTTLQIKEKEKEIQNEDLNNESEKITTEVIDDPMRYQHPNAKKVFIQVSEPEKKEEIDEKPKKRVHLDIIQTTALNAHGDVKKRFLDTKDTEDSLFLARSYYEKGDNKKAIYWALQTNKINSNIEESWLIFVKAKARSGNKKEARRILISYIKRTNSFAAKILLKEYKK